MPYYRKKPILVEARQYTGDNFLELQDWSADHVELSDYRDDAICVYTPEGLLWFDEGDYVIKGSTPAGRTSSKRPTRKWTDMRYLVEPTSVTELKEGDIIVYYTPRFEKTTASSMCPNDEKFT